MKQNILDFKLFVQNTLYLDLKPKLTILCCKYFCEATNRSKKNNILLFLVLLYSLISHKQLTKKGFGFPLVDITLPDVYKLKTPAVF